MDNNITILYVDDEPMNLKLFNYMFKSKFNVITADSGISGLDILEKNHELQIVLSDMKMPGMDGIDFIKMAKKVRPDITYFILTAFGETSIIKDAVKDDLISSYLSKPFSKEEIESSIISAINGVKIEK